MKWNKENNKNINNNQKHKIFWKRTLKLKYNSNNFDEKLAHEQNNYLALHQEIVLRKSNYFLVKNYFRYLAISMPLFIISLLITLALLIYSFTKKNQLALFISNLPELNYFSLLFDNQLFVIFVSGFIYAILNFIFMLVNSVEYRYAFGLYQKAYWALKNGNLDESLKIENSPSALKGVKLQEQKNAKFKSISELPSLQFFDYKLFRFFMKLNQNVEELINYSALIILVVYIILLGQIRS